MRAIYRNLAGLAAALFSFATPSYGDIPGLPMFRNPAYPEEGPEFVGPHYVIGSETAINSSIPAAYVLYNGFYILCSMVDCPSVLRYPWLEEGFHPGQMTVVSLTNFGFIGNHGPEVTDNDPGGRSSITITGNFDNYGTITNFGTINISSSGILSNEGQFHSSLLGDGSKYTINHGAIINGESAYFEDNFLSNHGTILNKGYFRGANFNSFTNPSAGTYGEHLNNYGTITNDSTGTLAGAIDNYGYLINRGDAHLQVLRVIDNGFLINDGSLNIYSNFYLDGTMSGTGSGTAPTLGPNAVIKPGNSPGSLTLIGDLIFTAGSQLEIEIASSTDFDQLNVVGSISFEPGSKILIKFLNDFLPETGDNFEFLTASTSIFDMDTVTYDISGLPSNYSWTISGNSGMASFSVLAGGAPIPTPSPYSLLLFGMPLLLRKSHRNCVGKQHPRHHGFYL